MEASARGLFGLRGLFGSVDTTLSGLFDLGEVEASLYFDELYFFCARWPDVVRACRLWLHFRHLLPSIELGLYTAQLHSGGLRLSRSRLSVLALRLAGRTVTGGGGCWCGFSYDASSFRIVLLMVL